MKVKINNKNYDVPQLTFGHFTQMEEQGFSVVEAFRRKQFMLISMGFVCVVAECEREEAERLIEQHVLGGGDIRDLSHAFFEAAMESDFFRKMLGLEKEEKKPAKKTKAEKVEENNQETTEA